MMLSCTTKRGGDQFQTNPGSPETIFGVKHLQISTLNTQNNCCNLIFVLDEFRQTPQTFGCRFVKGRPMIFFRSITMFCETVNILLNIPHIQQTPYINCLCMYLGRFICRGRFVHVGLSPLCQGEETIHQHGIQNLLVHSLSLPVLLYICQSSMQILMIVNLFEEYVQWLKHRERYLV